MWNVRACGVLTVCVCVRVDLFTGGFSYDHKFSVDTKTAGTVSGRALERARDVEF